MPAYLKIKDIRFMTYEQLERWWETDFSVLMSTAVAEATGTVHPTVKEALSSSDWIQQWADALYAATGELLSSVERMTYKGDGRLERTQKKAGALLIRLQDVNTELRNHRRGTEPEWSVRSSARLSVRAILGRHHLEEFREMRRKEVARRGLAGEHPFQARGSGGDRYAAIESGVEQGLVHSPVTDQIAGLLKAPFCQITDMVAQDIINQNERVDELRHPLMLRRWREALDHLCARQFDSAPGGNFTITLPAIDWEEMAALPDEEAWRVINRRRFIRGGAQRDRECRMHTMAILKVLAQREQEVCQPWREAGDAARDELADKYADQAQALLSAFLPFCLPDGETIDRARLTQPKREVLLRELKGALVDGRWRNLLT